MKLFTLSAVLLAISLMVAEADPLAVGADAPKITTIDQDGKPVDLGAIYAAGTTLVYFYPKAGSSACTREACSIRDTFSEIKAQGITVIGVSNDSQDAQKSFQDHNQLPFTLIPDEDHKVADAFGVPTLMFGWDKRQSFLISKGKIVWEDLDVKADNHTAEVLKAAKAIVKS